MDAKPHSAEYLALETREFWWNPDFLDLMARRWRLADARRVLDVGAGVGHWGQLLLPRCHPDATLTGLEREPEWVAKAAARAAAKGLGGRASYQQGVAQALPFPDGSFDFVTCQTVLIHLPDPVAALKEMKRVTAPGGLVAVAEPINMASSMVLGSTRFHDDVDELLELYRAELLCYRGKERLGLGNNSLGAFLPKLFREAGLEGFEAFQSDKVPVVAPPYADPEARASVVEAKDALAQGVWIYGREEMRRYYVAGGGDPSGFDALFERGLAATRRIVEAMEQGAEYSVGAGFFVLASARV